MSKQKHTFALHNLMYDPSSVLAEIKAKWPKTSFVNKKINVHR